MLCYFVFEFTMGGLNGEKMASSLQNKNYHIWKQEHWETAYVRQGHILETALRWFTYLLWDELYVKKFLKQLKTTCGFA